MYFHFILLCLGQIRDDRKEAKNNLHAQYYRRFKEQVHLDRETQFMEKYGNQYRTRLEANLSPNDLLI
jgi:hypothetical protein